MNVIFEQNGYTQSRLYSFSGITGACQWCGSMPLKIKQLLPAKLDTNGWFQSRACCASCKREVGAVKVRKP